MNIPALNAIRSDMGSEVAKYPKNPGDKNYIILYDEDYVSHGSDMEGNVALLVDKENAREIKRLAEEVIERLE